MIRDPDNSKNILICPDCLRDTIEHVKGYGDWWKKNVNNDPDLQKNMKILTMKHLIQLLTIIYVIIVLMIGTRLGITNLGIISI